MIPASWLDRLFEKLLVAIGILKMMVVVAFFASFSRVEMDVALADEVSRCEGINLVNEIKSESPDVYEAMLEKAASTENAESILWRIEKEGFEQSWLFGTMHMADPEISGLPDKARRALNRADKAVIETTDILDPSSSAKAMKSLGHLTLLGEGKVLSQIVRKDLHDELENALAQRGIPMQVGDRLQPWLVATTISLPVCEMLRKRMGAKVLDQVVALEASDQGKNVLGLETMSEQFEAIASLPIDYHVSALEETLANGSRAMDMIETLKSLYLQGQTGMFLPFLEAVSPESFSGEGAEKFHQALIQKRNSKMAERMIPMLEQGSSFVAVGALHLPGSEGLVNLLREEGFTVTAL